jgi:hypothetical protein
MAVIVVFMGKVLKGPDRDSAIVNRPRAGGEAETGKVKGKVKGKGEGE